MAALHGRHDGVEQVAGVWWSLQHTSAHKRHNKAQRKPRACPANRDQWGSGWACAQRRDGQNAADIAGQRAIRRASRGGHPR
jgi:hypothetical protein